MYTSTKHVVLLGSSPTASLTEPVVVVDEPPVVVVVPESVVVVAASVVEAVEGASGGAQIRTSRQIAFTRGHQPSHALSYVLMYQILSLEHAAFVSDLQQ